MNFKSIELYNPILPLRSRDPSYLRFLHNASTAVEDRLDYAIDLIKKRKLGIGKWHPTGFATFDVVSIDRLGLMRLHFWPMNLRYILPRHPQIHKHCFQLYSRIIAGEYSESQYEARLVNSGESKSPRTDYLRLQEFLVGPNQGDGIDRLEVSGRWIDAKCVFKGLRFPVGSWHEVEVGKFHSTPIPKQKFCVTLAILSLPVKGARDVLLGSRLFRTLTNLRPVVTEQEAETMCEQFKSAV